MDIGQQDMALTDHKVNVGFESCWILSWAYNFHESYSHAVHVVLSRRLHVYKWCRFSLL